MNLLDMIDQARNMAKDGDMVTNNPHLREAECQGCGLLESECEIYLEGTNITLFAQTGQQLCADCIPEQ